MPRVESAYKKGCEEGFIQGYREGQKELEAKIASLEDQMNSRLKVAEDQINLLGRLFSQLNEKQLELNDETREIIQRISQILKAESR